MIAERLQARPAINIPEKNKSSTFFPRSIDLREKKNDANCSKPWGFEKVLDKSDFRLEYRESSPDQVLIDDIVSYLGEYRFNLPKFSYTLKYSNGKLRDPHRGDPMQDLTQRSIDKNVSEGIRSARERAEKQGIVNLDRQLMSAQEGDTVVWASPPGSKEDGYGNYGFIFVGNVSVNHLSEKTVQMTAIRLEDPKIEQFNKAMHLLTGEKTDYKRAEEFLAESRVISGHLQEDYADALLGRAFSFKPNKEEQEKFTLIMRQMSPLISDFIRLAKDPWISKEEKIKGLYALENYALKLKKDYDHPADRKENLITIFKAHPRLECIIGEYGKEPPKVSGSCPASTSSSNLLSKNSFLNNLFGEQEWFHCPKCDYQADGPIGDTCPGCKLTKKEYARETGISCD